MMKQIAPYLIRAAGEIAKDTLTTYLDSRAPKQSTQRVEPLVTIIEPDQDDVSCPYCTITRRLTYAHRLIVEAKARPTMAELLSDAACTEISHAVAVAHRLEPGPPNGRIVSKLHKLEVTLLRALKNYEIDRVAADLWALTDLCIDMALVVRPADEHT